jgi:hypothetical protein
VSAVLDGAAKRRDDGYDADFGADDAGRARGTTVDWESDSMERRFFIFSMSVVRLSRSSWAACDLTPPAARSAWLIKSSSNASTIRLKSTPSRGNTNDGADGAGAG